MKDLSRSVARAMRADAGPFLALCGLCFAFMTAQAVSERLLGGSTLLWMCLPLGCAVYARACRWVGAWHSMVLFGFAALLSAGGFWAGLQGLRASGWLGTDAAYLSFAPLGLAVALPASIFGRAAWHFGRIMMRNLRELRRETLGKASHEYIQAGVPASVPIL